MAIEIREINIKTEIRTHRNEQEELSSRELMLFKQQLLHECKQMISQKTGRKKLKR